METIRNALKKDMPAVNGIINYYLVNDTANMNISPVNLSAREEIFLQVKEDGFTALVAQANGTIAAYAGLSKLFDKEGYKNSAEFSLYVKKEFTGNGIGARITKACLKQARGEGFLTTVASKITSDNEASIDLHKKFGFEKSGTFKNIGIKLGHFIDVELYQPFL